MPYRVTFSGQTSSTHQLCETAVLVASIPLFEEENPKTNEKINKFDACLTQLRTATSQFDFVCTDLLLRHNFEIMGQEQSVANDSALELAKNWSTRYDLKHALEKSNCRSFLSWENQVLKHDDYGTLAALVRRFYQQNTDAFMQKVVKVAADRVAFLSGKCVVDPMLALSKSIDYILEESVAVLLLRLSGKYQALFYIQGKLNEPTYDMATKNFNLVDSLLDKINQHPLTVVTVTRFDPIPTTSNLCAQPSVSGLSNSRHVVMFPSSKQKHSLAGEKQPFQLNAENQLPAREKISLATKAFFDSKIIPLKAKEDFLKVLFSETNFNPENSSTNCKNN